MTELSRNTFPFSAVQGQAQFKLALLLATVNPLLGGVLISGPRGCAKSTLSRAIADLLPTKNNQQAQFVTLPLGASEEMLIGTLDLESVLNNKSVKFSAGLLQKAHGGVLYVDEVNLLPDHLVDQLLDVASSGINVVERDGISHSHAAEFTLIGTMNPDEGELRPQLKDRFGLMVELDNQFSIEERINIIKTRQAFEQDKITFGEQYAAQQTALKTQVSQAQDLLNKVQCSDACFIEIATRCQQANVEGLRADIMMHRASITHAAWCGRSDVTFEDIEVVAPFVLQHRSQSGGTPLSPNSSTKNDNNDENNNSKNNNEFGFSRPTEKSNNETSAGSKSQNKDLSKDPTENKSDENGGEWGAMPKQVGEAQKMAHKIDLSLPDLATKLMHPTVKKLSETNKKSGQQVNLNSGHKSNLESNKPDWFATLSKNLGTWPPAKFAYKKMSKAQQNLHLILLDTSASTLTNSLSSVAKSVVLNISQGAYLGRDKMSLLGFGNDHVDTLIKAGRAPKEIATQLDDISAAGGTPLRMALANAKQHIKQFIKQTPNLQVFCYLITDGRSRVDLDDLKLSVPTLLIDIEKSQIKRGRGKVLAMQLDAQYLALQS